MTAYLGICLVVAIFTIALLARALYLLKAANDRLTSQVEVHAHAKFVEWKDRELGEQVEILRRQATVSVEEWKLKETKTIRNDAVKMSRAVIVGKVTEHVVPFLPEFSYNPKDARFLGNPVDFVVFDGLDEETVREVVFVEVKTQSSRLTKRQQLIHDAIVSGRVAWKEIRVDRAADSPTTQTLLEEAHAGTVTCANTLPIAEDVSAGDGEGGKQ